MKIMKMRWVIPVLALLGVLPAFAQQDIPSDGLMLADMPSGQVWLSTPGGGSEFDYPVDRWQPVAPDGEAVIDRVALRLTSDSTTVARFQDEYGLPAYDVMGFYGEFLMGNAGDIYGIDYNPATHLTPVELADGRMAEVFDTVFVREMLDGSAPDFDQPVSGQVYYFVPLADDHLGTLRVTFYQVSYGDYEDIRLDAFDMASSFVLRGAASGETQGAPTQAQTDPAGVVTFGSARGQSQLTYPVGRWTRVENPEYAIPLGVLALDGSDINQMFLSDEGDQSAASVLEFYETYPLTNIATYFGFDYDADTHLVEVELADGRMARVFDTVFITMMDANGGLPDTVDGEIIYFVPLGDDHLGVVRSMFVGVPFGEYEAIQLDTFEVASSFVLR